MLARYRYRYSLKPQEPMFPIRIMSIPTDAGMRSFAIYDARTVVEVFKSI